MSQRRSLARLGQRIKKVLRRLGKNNNNRIFPEHQKSVTVKEKTLTFESKLLNGTINPKTVFKMGKKIGDGSHGQVFAANDMKTKGKLAVKIMPITSEMEPIKNEVALQSIVSYHPNIVSCFGSFSFRESFYVQLEFVQGGSLYGKHISMSDFSSYSMIEN
jgi:serine/threonine protein kinase